MERLYGVVQTRGGAQVARHARDGGLVVALKVAHDDHHGAVMAHLHVLRPKVARELGAALLRAASDAVRVPDGG